VQGVAVIRAPRFQSARVDRPTSGGVDERPPGLHHQPKQVCHRTDHVHAQGTTVL